MHTSCGICPCDSHRQISVSKNKNMTYKSRGVAGCNDQFTQIIDVRGRLYVPSFVMVRMLQLSAYDELRKVSAIRHILSTSSVPHSCLSFVLFLLDYCNSLFVANRGQWILMPSVDQIIKRLLECVQSPDIKTR